MLEHFTLMTALGILLAGMASMIIGGIWYTPQVMGSAWMKETNFDPEKAVSPTKAMGTSLISNMIFAFGLYMLMQEARCGRLCKWLVDHY